MPRLPVPAEVVLLVHERARGRCELCGLPSQVGFHLHHRQPRGMGSSTRDPHTASNLLNLHPTCHLVRVERNRSQAYQNGWLVKHPLEPRETPVLLASGWVWLSDEGGSWAVEDWVGLR
jgi:hypothetical protein